MFKKTNTYRHIHSLGHNLRFYAKRGLLSGGFLDVDEVFDRLVLFCENCYRGEGFSFKTDGELPDVYSTTMAVGILGLLDELDVEWLDVGLVREYLGRIQTEDGVFTDKAVWVNQAPRLGWEHLCPIALAAFEYLGLTPRYPFANLKQDILEFISKEDTVNADEFLTQSNRFFDLSAMSLWNRDNLDSNEGLTLVEDLCDWALHVGLPKAFRFSDQGMFQRATAIKAIYHLVPILVFEGKFDSVTREKVEALVVSNRNLTGGWGPRWDSHACEDIDNLFLLCLRDEVPPKHQVMFQNWFENSFQSNVCADFGLSYRPYNGLDFFGANLLVTVKNQGDMFGSWFRCVCIAYLYKYLNGQGRNLTFTNCFSYQFRYKIEEI